MGTCFDNQVEALYEKANKITGRFLTANYKGDPSTILIPEDFKKEFFTLVDQVNVSLMEHKDQFYSYFLIHMLREIRFDITSPTAVNFKGAKYVIYFNPLIFLNLNLKQMESTIKHEILHIISMHLLRARQFKGGYSKLAINMAMNIVVNTYLDHLPTYAVTLEWVNLRYSLKLLPFQPFEYYVEMLQAALDLLEEDKDGTEDDSKKDAAIATEYDPEATHDLWENSSEIDEKTLKEFTEKIIYSSQKSGLPSYLESMIASLTNSTGELPWNMYLKRLMGTVESNKKRTIARRSRRQPDRFDVRGELRSYKAKIAVALDTSGSISDEEFNQAIKEVLNIVKNYNHEITIIECDNEIRRVYKVKSVKDIKDRVNIKGGTRFTPVFEYANQRKVNLLIYFTDGKGEDELLAVPKGYKTLWVLSGRGEKLSVKEAYGAVKKLKQIVTNEDTVNLIDVRKDGYSMNDQEKMHI